MQSRRASAIMPRPDTTKPRPLPQTVLPLSPASIRWTFLLLGLLAGALISWPLLSGDARGQVNLLAVLMLLALLPLLTLLLSLLALLRRRDGSMCLLWQALPLPAPWKQQLRQWRVSGESFWWLFYAGQWMATGFSLGNLGTFALLLLFSDLHFVWRSTLLDARDLQPWLDGLATPWRFWETAQPSLVQLEMSQGDRSAGPWGTAGLQDWWRFLLAAQLCYALLPRLLLAFWASRHLWRKHGIIADDRPLVDAPLRNELPETAQRAAEDALWVDAAWLPSDIAAGLPHSPVLHERELPEERTLVIVVRAWEPPLAELADRLRGRRGLLLPLDWDHSGLRPPRQEHIDEWRRFTATMDGWRVLRWSGQDE